MLWFKALKDFDFAGKAFKAGVIEAIDDQHLPTLIAMKCVEKAEKPAEATIIDEQLEKEIAGLIDTQMEGLQSTLKKSFAAAAKGATEKRRAIISTHDNELDDPKDGFKSLAEFSSVVRKACAGMGGDKRLDMRMKAAGASEGIAADGGYAVPVEFATNVFDDITGQDNLMSRCFLIPMTSASIKLPAINYTQQGQYGVQAYWTGEGATITTSKPPFRQPQLVLNKLAALVPVTTELLEDGIAIEPIITKLAGEAIGYTLNDAIVNGTGVGQPTGIVGHTATVSVAKTSGQASGTVTAVNVISMRRAFWGKSPTWFYSQIDVGPQLDTMQDPAGRYLYFAPGTFGSAPAQEERLNGIPSVSLFNCQPVGTPGDIFLADFKSYALGYKTMTATQAMSMHLYFASDQLAYRWTIRVDGRPWRDVPLTAAKSNLQYSPFVTLAQR